MDQRLSREALLARAALAASPLADPYADQRNAPRFAMLLRMAKLVCDRIEFVCVIRDASATGVSVRLFHPLPPSDVLLLELANGDRHPVQLVWQGDDRAGLKFLRETDVARLIECPSTFSRRPLRVRLDQPVRLLCGVTAEDAQLLDLSQQGAKVACTRHLAIDQRVRLTAKTLPEVNAKVRWRRGESYGLVFEDTFQLEDLARTVAALQGVR